MIPNERIRNMDRGSALLIVLILMVVAAGVCGAMLVVHTSRAGSSFDADSRISRMYAAEAGLELAKLEVMANGGWLAASADRGPVITRNVGGNTVRVSVKSEDGSWFTVESASESPDGTVTTLNMNMRGGVDGRGGSFADYARFVSKGVLDIGSYASYGGKVHCNSNINVQGDGVVFWEDVTAAGRINPRNDTVFHKNATSGVAQIELPGEDQLEGLARSAPSGAIVYDPNDPIFKNKFLTATGSAPNSTLEVKVVLKQDKMDVISTCTYTSGGPTTTKTMTESNVPVPHNGTIFIKNNKKTTVSGNISRRMSVVSPNDIYINGPVRYTDDSGGPQWVLKNSTTGQIEPFDSSTNSWSTMGRWDGPPYKYEEAADWMDRKPADNPALGIVTAKTIYITGANENREIHAALFTSGDVIRPSGITGTKKNLYILGAIITTGTNPVSSYFSYRCYAYDPHLKGTPPPGFPLVGGQDPVPPAVANWHVVMPADSPSSHGY